MFWPAFKVYRPEKWAKTYDALCKIFRIGQHISLKTLKKLFCQMFFDVSICTHMTVSVESLIVHGI